MLTAKVSALVALAFCVGAQARLVGERQSKFAGLQTRFSGQGALRKGALDKHAAVSLPAYCRSDTLAPGASPQQAHAYCMCGVCKGLQTLQEVTASALHEGALQGAWWTMPQGACSSCQSRRAGQRAAMPCQALLLPRLRRSALRLRLAPPKPMGSRHEGACTKQGKHQHA